MRIEAPGFFAYLFAFLSLSCSSYTTVMTPAYDQEAFATASSGGSRPQLHQCRPQHHRPCAQVSSIALYVVSWVANAEILQAICNGALLMRPYNKPVFLTWLSYNAMIAGFVLVAPWIYRERQMSVWQFVVSSTWRGTWSLWHMMLACTGLSFLLTACHVLYVMGLHKISVAALNAVYQLQAACTLTLTVTLLGGRFTAWQCLGIVTSIVGIAAIVVPPLFLVDGTENKEEQQSWNDTLWGTLATMGSALLWGLYQVAWQALHTAKLGNDKHMTPTEELVDTLVNLAVIGVANLTVGWILLPVADATGLETLAWPKLDMFPVLTLNAMVEYAFNALIALAIHQTSPLATSLTAPLTIPLSWIADQVLYDIPVASATAGAWGWIGALWIVVGLYWMEFQNNSSDDSNNDMDLNSTDAATTTAHHPVPPATATATSFFWRESDTLLSPPPVPLAWQSKHQSSSSSQPYVLSTEII